MKFYTEKDLALCGLACVLCSSEDCPGCKARGCKEESDCSVYRCTTTRGLDGCYQCSDFPCDERMLQGLRNRAFNRYAKQYGKEALLNRLEINNRNGIIYHKPDGLKGDYDLPETEEEILRLIHFGTHDPYDKCPILETELFTFQLVQMEDAEDLFECYSDLRRTEIFTADKYIRDFRYQKLEDMKECIRFWLEEYHNRVYIRFSILCKKTNRAIGTIEMFNASGHLAGSDTLGILRLDLAPQYEKQTYIEKILELGISSFYGLWSVKHIVILAIPSAKERISALEELDFEPFRWPNAEREHYWIHNKG